jgi:ABC-type lipoprotein release transport system permease subunit
MPVQEAEAEAKRMLPVKILAVLADVSSSDSSGDSESEQTNGQTQESEPLTPVYLGEDMLRVWFISVGLSVMAGLYPAWKASRYLPVDALRAL